MQAMSAIAKSFPRCNQAIGYCNSCNPNWVKTTLAFLQCGKEATIGIHLRLSRRDLDWA